VKDMNAHDCEIQVGLLSFAKPSLLSLPQWERLSNGLKL